MNDDRGDPATTRAANDIGEAPVFDLYSEEIDRDPFPAYARLREDHPCYWSDANGVWILSRYDDVSAAAQDWRTYSSLNGNLIDELPGRAGATLGTTDPPRHDRLRGLAQAAFMRRNLEHLAEPVREIAAQALDLIGSMETFDFVSDFSSHVTVGVLFRMLGLPAQDPAEVRRKVVLSISTDKSLKGRNAEQVEAFSQLGAFVAEQVAERRRAPQDDLITALAVAEIDGDRLSEREVVLTTATFVMAGVESLSSFMSVFALNMATFAEERRKVCADPALLAPAIEESLRFNTSAQRFKRTLTRDVELHGQAMRAGEKVALAYGSANRDWRRFDEPDRYDVNRRPQSHLGFGTGPHFCLGSQMARLVSTVAMGMFLDTIPEFELTGPDLAWTPSSNFRTPVSLRLRRGEGPSEGGSR